MDKIILLSKLTRPASRPSQPSLKGYWGSLYRLNWPVHEVNHCCASSSELIVELHMFSPCVPSWHGYSIWLWDGWSGD